MSLISGKIKNFERSTFYGCLFISRKMQVMKATTRKISRMQISRIREKKKEYEGFCTKIRVCNSNLEMLEEALKVNIVLFYRDSHKTSLTTVRESRGKFGESFHFLTSSKNNQDILR